MCWVQTFWGPQIGGRVVTKCCGEENFSLIFDKLKPYWYNESEPVLYEDAASLEYELNLTGIGEIDLGDIKDSVEIGSIEITISQPIIA